MTTAGARTREVKIDWAGPHHTVWGTFNLGLSAFTVVTVAYSAALPVTYPVGVVAVLALATQALTVHQDLCRRTQVYRFCVWLALAAWAYVGYRVVPWSAESLAWLFGVMLATGVLAPGFVRLENNRVEKRRLALVWQQRRAAQEQWTERLRRISNRQGVEVVGLVPWEGDPSPGYTLDCKCSGGVTWRDFLDVQDRLAADVPLPNGCGVQVKQGETRGDMIVYVATVNRAKEHSYVPREYGARTINDPLTFGWFGDGTPAQAMIRQLCWLIVGATGVGKTTLLNRIISQLVRCTDAVVWVMDANSGALGVPWAEAFYEKKAHRPAVDWIAGDKDEIALMARAMLAIAKDRKVTGRVIKRKHNVTLLPVSPKLSALIVMGDEIGEILGDGAPTDFRHIKEDIKSSVRMGRDSAIRMVLSAVRGTSDIVEPQVKKLSEVRVAMGVTDQAELDYILDYASGVKPEDIPGLGGGIVIPGRQQAARPFYGDDMLPDQVEECSIAVQDLRPGLDRDALRALAKEFNDEGGLAVYEERWNRCAWLFAVERDEDADEEIEDRETDGTDEPGGGEGGEQVTRTDDGGQESTDPRQPRRYGTDGWAPWTDEPKDMDAAKAEMERTRRELEEAVRAREGVEPAENMGEDPVLEREFLEVIGTKEQWFSTDDPRDVEAPATPGQPTPKEVAFDALRRAGRTGCTVKELTEELTRFGYTTDRTTVWRWLKAGLNADPPYIERADDGREGAYRLAWRDGEEPV